MKKLFTFLAATAFIFSLSAQQSDDCNGCVSQPVKPVANQLPNSTKGLLIDNGSFITNAANPADPDSSVLQLTSNTLGGGFQSGLGYAIADDFVIATGSWAIDSIQIFGYQTGSDTLASTFTGLFIRIWDGDPSSGGTVVWGDTTTNVLDNTYWSHVYRGSSSSWGTTRPIMVLTAAPTSLTLSAGTYWIEFQAAGSGASGPWCVPITIVNQEMTGDAYQRAAGVFNPWTDTGSLQGLGAPFKIYGTAITSLEENDVMVNIFPNPAKTEIRVNADENINRVIMYDQTGNTVVSIETSGTQASISTSDMTPGVYYILTETESGISSTKIIVE